MKRFTILIILSLAVALPAGAQQPDDAKVATYRDLLTEANDRLTTINAKAMGLQEQVKALTVERDKLKAEAAKAVEDAKRLK